MPHPSPNADSDNSPEIKSFPSSKRIWIIPSNIAIYDFISAFNKHSEIDWQQSANYKIGDIIYIYCSKPYQRIMFHVEVTKVIIPFNETIDDTEFWTNESEKDLAKNRIYARLKLLQNGLKLLLKGQ